MLSLQKVKSCSRCGGTLSLERDQYGVYVTCIQCGAVWNQTEAVRKPRVDEKRPASAAKRDMVGTH